MYTALFVLQSILHLILVAWLLTAALMALDLRYYRSASLHPVCELGLVRRRFPWMLAGGMVWAIARFAPARAGARSPAELR